ncbi:MAG: bifunctional protein-serine/threonine kinase/phosphatase [Motiliproteus sp.]|nr:bifunctional protein-serine/threonine kinase/phosphatase [Motiliproteus sp.]MCW9054038.1 bifunctional protein-serine/threonine kinase/phosphatase [Motiliproteus sp.]
MSESLKVSIGGLSIAGIKEQNQDAFAAQTPDSPLLQHKGVACALADGVSSSAESHVASQTSVTQFLSDYYSTPDSWSVKNSAAKVLTALNRWLYQHGNSGSRAKNSLVTTFSAIVIKSTTAHLFHVGDSRIYRLRDGELELLTQDHASNFGGNKSYLTRALGIDSHVEVDYRQETVEKGDLFMLSTDGLHEFIGKKALIGKLSALEADLEAEAKKLVHTALEAGSDDNISCLLVHVDQLPVEELDEAHRKLTHLPIPPVLEVGNSIDGYEVQEVLFSGTRSHLYLVRDKESQQLFALKTPSENFAEDPLYLDGFIKEEWVGKRINHPSVMKVFTPVREKKFLYYLSEYIPGQSLRQWMVDNPKPDLDQVRELIKQIAVAVRALDRLEMIHQDLKPENILIDRNGRVKLIDFGTVRIKGIDEISSPLENDIPQGSVNYVAPEYLLGQKGTHCSDLFSIGVIAYEMLTGKVPYKERPANNYMIKGYGELDYLSSRHERSDLPDWIEGCLAKACAADPSRRYPVLSEFLFDLDNPNRAFQISERNKPLIEKNPLLVWKGLCVLLFLLNAVQLLL